eukprot:CAMPEP_0185589898 /NCGR_PEP_ID=MMETSP0434-20130131/58736_1 /TAXON_ID=626734 ORGANISM="Favella taraikaensis, Strain Fe Narragansett Bay" /NCGR_SAMPLE_ID=MMETSP0434 /ASSEMBLY_ACC=CAM_ASM_000379 /LENGTH=85 /DNA_ID=CAMNT_0028213655 /DNA_START=555 /DNA_END=811 /DNA_ORIENTATION=+
MPPDADVVVSEGRDAAASALVHPEDHEHVIALLVRVVEEEAVAAGHIHQVALGRLELYLKRAHSFILPNWQFLGEECFELLFCLG